MTKDEKIAKLGKEITDRATVLLGKDKITPDTPEYLGINSALKFTAVKYDEKMADDILDIALTMKKRVPLTIEQLAKKNPQFDRAYLEKAMQAISESGLVEFHWENLDGKNPNHEKRWVLDMLVPGSAEIMMINPEQSDMFPETADFFERMAYLPLAGITEMVPPGGAGIGMHVIPVEKAIPAESKSLPIEHLSHWLKKYEGHIGVSVCSCRKQQRIRGEGSGDVEGEWCIGVGDFADYCRETNHGRDITYEEAMEILQKAEDRGYVHQITNIDGENKIFGICNCAVGVCNALRTSQLFNTPNLSASAYVAESDPEKCVACGKCVETCPAGAVRLGQKLCTKEGPIQYPHHELPDDTKWGEDHWNKNYRNENGCIQTWPTGTAPCKAACPAHIAIQGYIKMAGDGRYADALKLIKKDTVMENIRYGNPDATDDECIAAAKLANADHFIRMLPDGYNTVLKGDGSGLSQGQRQLLSIARAAVSDPPVMILDEATSSIDTRTEALVQSGMDKLMEGRTVFVIAHRLSTVKNADVIMVLDHGRIIERGNHAKLIAEKGVYYQLYTGAFELE